MSIVTRQTHIFHPSGSSDDFRSTLSTYCKRETFVYYSPRLSVSTSQPLRPFWTAYIPCRHPPPPVCVWPILPHPHFPLPLHSSDFATTARTLQYWREPYMGYQREQKKKNAKLAEIFPATRFTPLPRCGMSAPVPLEEASANRLLQRHSSTTNHPNTTSPPSLPPPTRPGTTHQYPTPLTQKHR